IFIIGGKDRAAPRIQPVDIGLDGAAIGRVMAAARDGDAARGHEALGAVFKSLDRHFPVSLFAVKRTRKALEKQMAARIFRCGHQYPRARVRQAAFSRPTTNASCSKSKSWFFHSREVRPEQADFEKS